MEKISNTRKIAENEISTGHCEKQEFTTEKGFTC